MDTTTENEAKEAAIKKAHIDNLTAEGMAAASKELAEEEEEEEEELLSGAYPENPIKPEATIPETKDLDNINSLFSK